MAQINIVERRGWDARRSGDRTSIRGYALSKVKDHSNCPPALVLHLLDIIDGLADALETDDL